ncbi:MAG: SPOR domain-containing protein [Sphingomicrobium sp.]
MAQNGLSRARVATLILGCVTLVLAVSSTRAQLPYGATQTQTESAPDRLSRYLRVLADRPRDFQALVGAGRAALDVGDSQAAAGFFGRADEVWPTSPLPPAGMGAATVLEGDATGALGHFARAQRLGATPMMMGADRGLAYDLMGRHSEAQADYRAALIGAQGDEARRRLAISLAVTGSKDEALATLSPLLLRRDPGAVRTRALVLALTGDTMSARSAVESAMPGAWPQMAPFIARLTSLNSADKAAAANLGIFPGSGQTFGSSPALAGVAPPVQRGLASGRPLDRLADIDALLRGPSVQSAAPQPAIGPPVAGVPPPPASAAISAAGTTVATSVAPRRRYWVQVASGASSVALPAELRRIRTRSEDLLKGVSGYIAEEPGRTRLLVGPFRSSSDAEIFAEELGVTGVDAFRWISPEGQVVRKLTTE